MRFSALPLLFLSAVGVGVATAEPKLFLCSDSTAANFNPQKTNLQGFGYFLADYFSTGYQNLARSGRSTRSFINEGLWKNLLDQVKAGDYVVIEMGHNDNGRKPGEGIDIGRDRITLKGTGDETVVVKNQTGGDETVRTFGSYLRQMIADVEAHQAYPVLSGMVPQMAWTDGNLRTTWQFTEYTREVASQENVLFLDHTKYSVTRFQEIGENASMEMFPRDHTHTNAGGAQLNAESFVTAWKCATGPGSEHLPQYLTQKGKDVKGWC